MEDKYQEIITKAKYMFGEYSIHSVSMDDISREVSISKKTLYQHYNNKSELLEAIFNFEIDRVGKEAQQIKEQSRNAIDALLIVSKIMGQHSIKTKPTVAFDMKKYYPELYKRFLKKKRELTYEGIVKNMKRGISEGIYREELNVELVAYLYVKKIEHMHDQDIMENSDFSQEDIFQVMFENHIRGISNQKGIEIFEKEKQNFNFNIDDDKNL